MAGVDAARDHGVVEALRQHVDGARAVEARLVEHERQRDAAPARDADRAELPLRSGRRRALLAREEAAAVAGALHERGDLLRGQLLQVAEAERVRMIDVGRSAQAAPEDLQLPGRGVDQRGGGVVAHEEALVGGLPGLARHGVPAHLGIRADDREPLGWQRLDDRPGRRSGQRVVGECGRCQATGGREQRDAGGSRPDQRAARDSTPLGLGEQLLAACLEVVLLVEQPLVSHGSRSQSSLSIGLLYISAIGSPRAVRPRAPG